MILLETFLLFTTLGSKLNLIKETRSICPQCHKVIPARVFEEGNVVYIDKECPEHGYFRDVYWGDYEFYRRGERWAREGSGIQNPRTETVNGCPFDCGICPAHRSHTVLAIIDVTNRCVTGDTKVILQDGSLMRISDLVQGKVSGRILSWSKLGYTPSFNEIDSWQRLEAPQTLIEINTRTGKGTFTPDHEVLVDTAEGPALRRADAIRPGDRIYSVARIPIPPKPLSLIDILADAKTDFFVYSDHKNELKDILRGIYGSYRNVSRKLGIKYERLTDPRISLSAKDFKKLNKWILKNLKFSKIKHHHRTTLVSFNEVNVDLAYLLGLIDSDGTVVTYRYPRGSTNYVAFDNKRPELRGEFRKVSTTLFPNLRIRKEKEQRLVSSSLLVCTIANALSLKNENSFQRLFALNESLIASFVSGYLDGDGHVALKASEIAFTFVRRRVAERMQYLLKRLGIVSSVCRLRFGKEAYSHREYFYKCRIVGERSKLLFAELIKPRHPEKRKKLGKLKAILLQGSHTTSYSDSAPKHILRAVKDFLASEGYPLGSLRGSSTICEVAAGRRGCSKQYVQHQLEILLGEGGELLELSGDYYLDEVINVRSIQDHDEKYVYDVTVSGTHLFVANGGLVVSNCNMACEVCFAYAGAAGYVYEPTKEQIGGMLDNLRANQPVAPPALQFSGGEPTVRADLPELIRMAKERGFRHVEVNTNGLRLAGSVDYCRELKEAGVSTIYLQFDGVTPEPTIKLRGANYLSAKLKALENLREAGWRSVVLVPTLVKGINDDQLGALVDFAVKNRDVVRGVNIQPVSITGRIDYDRRKEMRITIPDCLKLIEEQTNGKVRMSDFYPVPFVVPLSRAMGAIKEKRYVEFTAHPHCIDGAEILTLYNDEHLRLSEVGSFVDGLIDRFRDEVTSFGECEILDVSGQNIKVASRSASGKSKKVRILKVMRQPRKKVYRIVTKHGFEVRLTAEHKVFVYDDERRVIGKKLVKDLRPGDLLLPTSNLPESKVEPSLDLTKELEGVEDIILRNLRVRNIKKPLKELKKKYGGTWVDFFHGIGVNCSRRQIENWLYRDSLPFNIFHRLKKFGIAYDDALLGYSRSRKTIPIYVDVKPELARLIGYYLAEGHNTERVVGISNSDSQVIADVERCLQALNWKYRKAKAHDRDQVYLDSKVHCLLFRHILRVGGRASRKRVPDILLSSPPRILVEALSGLISGDGNVHFHRVNNSAKIHYARIHYITSSYRLATGLHTMLLRLNFQASVHRRRFKGTETKIEGRIMRRKHDAYVLTIGGIRNLRKLLDLGFSLADKDKQRKIKDVIASAKRSFPPSLVGFDPVVEVSEVETPYNYVYDIEVDEPHGFALGLGGIYVHNCGVATYLVWDEEGYKPVTRFGDVEKVFAAFEKAYEQASAGHTRRAKFTLL
ncbi:MAG: LAGLIDADG family homing endonuclease, partial [Candidatus Bathyarchaeia archaeon]